MRIVLLVECVILGPCFCNSRIRVQGFCKTGLGFRAYKEGIKPRVYERM